VSSRYDDLDRPPLNAAAVRRVLVTPGSLWTQLEVVQQTKSTNEDMRRLAKVNAPSGSVLIAEEQTAGRGRLGRTWTAPARSSLTMSVLLRPQAPLATPLGWIPLLAALAVDDALRRAELGGTGVKWPNDVMVNERKIAGILSERVDHDGSLAVVVGMGINVGMRASELPTPEATSLDVLGQPLDREVLLKSVLRCLATRYEQFGNGEGDALRHTYLERSTTVGQQVRVELPDGEAIRGVAVDVDESGALLVDEGSGVRVVAAADVSHVRANL